MITKIEDYYNEIPFSLEKANVQGNMVVTRGDKLREVEWAYFKTRKSEYRIAYIDRYDEFTRVREDGLRVQSKFGEDCFQPDDLIIMELKEEIK